MGSCCCPGQLASSLHSYSELDELLEIDKLTIRTVTYNVAGMIDPHSSASQLQQLVKQKREMDADIVVIGLQEIIDVSNAMNLVVDDDSDNKWISIFNEALPTYSKLKKVRLVGVLLLIYCKKPLVKEICDLMTGTVSAGLFGAMPNKGAVGVRFDIYSCSICFVCAHLTAHRPNVESRNANFHKIMDTMAFIQRSESLFGGLAGGAGGVSSDDMDAVGIQRSDSYQGMGYLSIDSHDVVFFFGDLNYRLDFELDQWNRVHGMIKKQSFEELLAADQLLTQIENGNAFEGFKESVIEFAPSYKFKMGAFEYTQKRIPSWTDRILWKLNYAEDEVHRHRKINCLEYKNIGITAADHQPVVGVYELCFQSDL